jgi:hypothetical protein
MNEKTAKRVRRALRKMAPAHWPEREYAMVDWGSTMLVPGCKRQLYKILKRLTNEGKEITK